MFVGNSFTSKVEKKGKVVLKKTLDKELGLNINVYDLKFIQISGGKKYFITFVMITQYIIMYIY